MASFVFEWVLHLKMKGKEGKSKGKDGEKCVRVGSRVGNQIEEIAESARR